MDASGGRHWPCGKCHPGEALAQRRSTVGVFMGTLAASVLLGLRLDREALMSSPCFRQPVRSEADLRRRVRVQGAAGECRARECLPRIAGICLCALSG